jgi:acetyl-CoA carboxylase biotin carboxyl carrier protein
MNKKNGEADQVELELVRRLADLLTETGLTEIEVEQAGLRVKVVRGLVVAQAPAMQAFAGPSAAPAVAPAAEAAAPRGDVVKSPMVGTCYLQANPGSEPFVRPGAQVAEGQTLMIVEAMKTMNPIPSPRAGKVLEILVDDGQPVEFGEPLVVLE